MKKDISKILIKWNMPTRQVAINEIVNLFKEEGRKEREKIRKELWEFAIKECDSFDPDMVGIHRCSAGHCGHCGKCDVISEILMKF